MERRETCLTYEEMMLSLAVAQRSSVTVAGRKISDASCMGGLQDVCSLSNDLHEISYVALSLK